MEERNTFWQRLVKIVLTRGWLIILTDMAVVFELYRLSGNSIEKMFQNTWGMLLIMLVVQIFMFVGAAIVRIRDYVPPSLEQFYTEENLDEAVTAAELERYSNRIPLAMLKNSPDGLIQELWWIEGDFVLVEYPEGSVICRDDLKDESQRVTSWRFVDHPGGLTVVYLYQTKRTILPPDQIKKLTQNDLLDISTHKLVGTMPYYSTYTLFPTIAGVRFDEIILEPNHDFRERRIQLFKEAIGPQEIQQNPTLMKLSKRNASETAVIVVLGIIMLLVLLWVFGSPYIL